MQTILSGDENTLLYTHPHNFNSPSEKTDLGKKIQSHIPFGTTLEMDPYMAPGHAPTQRMKLIGIISHQGTKDHAHYIAMTNRGDEWTSYNDAITTQTTMTHLQQTQAYILIYRKTGHSTGTGKATPRGSTMASQPRPTEKATPRHKTHHRVEKPALQPDPPIKTLLAENLPRQGRTDVGANPNPNPTHKEGPTTENLKVLESLLSNRCIPQVLETKGEDEEGGATERGGVSGPPTERADDREQPLLQEEEPGQAEDEPIDLLQSISIFSHLSQGRIEELTSLLSEMSGTPLTMEMTCKWLDLEPQTEEIPHDSRTKKLIDCLSEDPEDHPDGFISTIERHNAGLKKAHLLHEATSDIIQQK